MATISCNGQQRAGLCRFNTAGRLHVVANDALFRSIRDYTQSGGQTLLVYDFGTMALNGKGQRTFSTPKARLSDLAGVDYALYDGLGEKSIVVGTIAAMRSTLRASQVPPGTSSLYELPDPPASGLVASANRSTLWVKGVQTPGIHKPMSSVNSSGNNAADNPGKAADVLESYSGKSHPLGVSRPLRNSKESGKVKRL